MKRKTYLTLVLLLLTSFLASIFGIFHSADRFIMDKLYQSPSKTDNRIRIIAIDEKTLDQYGPFSSWSREKCAALLALLNSSEKTRPAVIGFDIMFIGESDPEIDALLANACNDSYGIVTAINIVNETVLESSISSGLIENNLHISFVEKPYAALAARTQTGFANTSPDDDSYVRRSILYRTHENKTIDSFSNAVYKLYCQAANLRPYTPDLGSFNEFSFSYSGKPGSYEVVSLADVLDGIIDPKTFRDCIVLVGAYAPGMQDAYNTPIDHSEQMYGVEIHANIIQALIEERTYTPLPPIWNAVFTSLITVLFYLIVKKIRIIPGAILGLFLIAVEFLIGILLFQNGWEISLIPLPVFLILTYGGCLVKGYLDERRQRKKVVSAFKKYVAPQIVDELSKKGQFDIALGGENRDIAVLFVDIRGFTPLSEKLKPEQVVEILNEYLTLTTHAIFKNGGTLDKFIGDATMAVFNAPFDLEDYIYKAVLTARDITKGALELEKRLSAQFGESISFGIGINCGPAVVGNIGCDFRMDYTAIGDTVNTAARLESNAKSGQILISQFVYEHLRNRITVSELGTIPLKGKSNGIQVYQLEDIL